MKTFAIPAAALAVSLVASPLFAQSTDTLQYAIYGGAGVSSDDREANDHTQLAIGMMYKVTNSPLVVGFDIAREGIKSDSTWYRSNADRTAMSFNFLVGANLYQSGTHRIDAALLAGVREEAQSCRRSYIGYQCYADTAPNVDYTGNFGAVLTVSFDRFVIGARATSESTQLLVGFRF